MIDRTAGPVRASALLAAFALLFAEGCGGHGDARADEPGSAARSDAIPPIRPAAPLGEGMGIQVQPWYLATGDLARIQAAGFRVVRWGIPWDRVERVRGTYDWHEIDPFVRALGATPLRSVVILGYGNPLYAASGDPASGAGAGGLVEARPPATPEARMAFARFAAAAAARYRDQPITWEIWNEPDNAAFWAPRPDPAAYAALAGAACSAIRKAVPGASVLGGAGAAMPDAVSGRAANIYAALAHGPALGCLDGLSGHAYRMSFAYDQPDPESAAADVRASRAYLYADLGMPATKRFVVSEWGFTTTRISANLQAAYLIRANLINAAGGVPLTVWYEWRDSRSGAVDPEAHFGLYAYPGGPKNTVGALDILSRIAGATFVREVPAGREGVRLFLLKDSGKYMLAAWIRTSDEEERLKLTINGGGPTAISFVPTLVDVPGPGRLSVQID